MKILSNKIQCNKCKDIIESTYRHEFKSCACGAVSVDGGIDYLRRIGNEWDYTELSEIIEKPNTYCVCGHPINNVSGKCINRHCSYVCPECGFPTRAKSLGEGGGIECSKKCGYWFCY